MASISVVCCLTLRPVRGGHCTTVRPQNHSNITQFVSISKWTYSRHMFSWIYFKYTNHFNFTCYPIDFASTRRFNLCRNRQTFQNFRHDITLWIYAFGSTFSQNRQLNYKTTSTYHEDGEKIDLYFGYSTVIKNDFQCWLTVHIDWWRVLCASSTFHLVIISETCYMLTEGKNTNLYPFWIF
jgi:hypothetical protein